MNNNKFDLDRVMADMSWPQPSAGLKGRILAAAESEDKKNILFFGKVSKLGKLVATLPIAVVFSFALGLTMSETDGQSVSSYIYPGTGSAIVSEIFY